jgi:preprotein translocase subunit SecD
MTHVKDLLRDADPVRAESSPTHTDREQVRRATIAAAAAPTATSPVRRRAVLAAAVIAVAGLAIAGSKLWLGSPTLHAAAVRFEIRLAESTPTLDLQPARIAGSDRVIYLHREAIVTNDDIAAAHVMPGSAPDQFHVGVTLLPAAGERMRTATAAHIGRPVALLVDGDVVSAPTVRSAIGAEALITGNFTRDEADRIANGMLLR